MINLLCKVFLCCVLFSSCVSPRELTYMQPSGKEHLDVYSYERLPYRLRENDVLDIQVQTLDDKANKLFKSTGGQNMQMGVQMGGDPFYITGYAVSAKGTIELPYIGEINVEGKTLQEAREAIDAEVSTLFKNYFLTVKLGGIRFSAIGEFRNPGKKLVLQNQLTLFEAIATCGDMTAVADRGGLQIIRQYPDGTRIHTVNTLEDTIISSPYYFIQPNDILHAPPLPEKAYGFGVTGAQSITILTGALSTSLALVLSILSLTR